MRHDQSHRRLPEDAPQRGPDTTSSISCWKGIGLRFGSQAADSIPPPTIDNDKQGGFLTGKTKELLPFETAADRLESGASVAFFRCIPFWIPQRGKTGKKRENEADGVGIGGGKGSMKSGVSY